MQIKRFLNIYFWCNKIPFRRLIYLLLRKVWNTKDQPHLYLKKRLQKFSFRGIFYTSINEDIGFYLYNEPNLYIETNLFWTAFNQSTYEISSYAIWARISKTSNLILDIGANSGTFSILSKAVNPKCTVFAFEPLQKNYLRLKKNNAINQFDINCIQKAISNTTGRARFHVQNTTGSYGSTLEENHKFETTTYSIQAVETIELKKFIEKNKISQIDLIKLDVEKHEYQVLKSMGEYLEKFYPSILIEIMNKKIAEQIQALINETKLDYEYYHISRKAPYVTKFLSIQKLGESNNSWGNYLICKPSIAQKIGLGKKIKKIDSLFN